MKKIIEDLAWAWKSLRQTIIDANYKPQKATFSSSICVPKPKIFMIQLEVTIRVRSQVCVMSSQEYSAI